jgi:hypothetical protein
MYPRKLGFFPGAPFVKQPSARRMFSSDEDTHLKSLVAQYGESDWKLISREMQDRSARQCRERFKNYLSPQLSMRPWSQSEDDLLREKCQEVGQKWAQISSSFVGRSDVSLKNRWIAITTRPSFGPRSSESVLTISPVEDVQPPEPPAPKGPGTDPSDFSIAQLLWTSPDRTNALKGELGIESERPDSAFPNYGGRLW